MFIHLYCFAVCFSVYNFMIKLMIHSTAPAIFSIWYRHLQLSFNELLPAIISLLVLALASSTMRTPKQSPYFQLYLAVRILSIVMVVDSSVAFFASIIRVTKM